MQAVFPGIHIISDVVVSNPLCPTHVQRAAGKQLAVAEQAAHAKVAKYRELADENQATLVPFSVEATGGLDKRAVELIDQISLASRDQLTAVSPDHITNHLKGAVAVAIQRGNAAIMHAAYARAVLAQQGPGAA